MQFHSSISNILSKISVFSCGESFSQRVNYWIVKGISCRNSSIMKPFSSIIRHLLYILTSPEMIKWNLFNARCSRPPIYYFWFRLLNKSSVIYKCKLKSNSTSFVFCNLQFINYLIQLICSNIKLSTIIFSEFG